MDLFSAALPVHNHHRTVRICRMVMDTYTLYTCIRTHIYTHTHVNQLGMMCVMLKRRHFWCTTEVFRHTQQLHARVQIGTK